MYHSEGKVVFGSHGILLFLVFASGDDAKLKNLLFDANITKKVAEKWSAKDNRK